MFFLGSFWMFGTLLSGMLWMGCPPKHSVKGEHPASQQSPASQPRYRVATSGGLQLMIAPSPVSLGQSFTVWLKNTGPTVYRYRFPGGSNGCVLPIYRLTLEHANGQKYQNVYDGPGRKCTQAIVPAQTIIIAVGESMPIKADTGQYWYLQPESLTARPKRSTLPVGIYRVWVKGGQLQLSSPGFVLQSK